MNSGRRRAPALMEALQPFTQLGVLAPARAKSIVMAFIAGDNTPLQDFVIDPDMPMTMLPICENIRKNFI